jgi:hypothetical protein
MFTKAPLFSLGVGHIRNTPNRVQEGTPTGGIHRRNLEGAGVGENAPSVFFLDPELKRVKKIRNIFQTIIWVV